MESQFIFALFAGFFAAFPFVIYFRSILNGETKPHIYTRFLYLLLTSIIFLVQISHDPGYGSVWLGVMVICCLVSYILSFKYGTNDITTFDKYCLAIGLITIPIWYVSGNPFYTLLLAVFIDIVATFPTLRKTYVDPSSENRYFYLIGCVGNIFALLSLNNLGLMNSLYPSVLFLVNISLVLIIVLKKKA